VEGEYEVVSKRGFVHFLCNSLHLDVN